MLTETIKDLQDRILRDEAEFKKLDFDLKFFKAKLKKLLKLQEQANEVIQEKPQ